MMHKNGTDIPVASLNNRLILEAYVPGPLKAKTQNGFAAVSQRVELKGLKVLVDALLADGTLIKAGSTAFVKERSLHTLAMFKELYECEGIEGKFMVVPQDQIEFVR